MCALNTPAYVGHNNTPRLKCALNTPAYVSHNNTPRLTCALNTPAYVSHNNHPSPFNSEWQTMHVMVQSP